MPSTRHGSKWLKALHMSWENSNVHIFVQEEIGTFAPTAIFPAHSLVLRCQSQVFDDMFSSDKFLEDNTYIIRLQGFTARAMEYFLRFLYTESLPDIICTNHMIEIFNLSHMYETQDLYLESSERLSLTININNVCEVYQNAFFHQAKELSNKCLRFIRDNLNTIWKNDLFHGIRKNIVYQFIFAEAMKENWVAFWRLNKYMCCTEEKWTEDQLHVINILEKKSPPKPDDFEKVTSPHNLYLDGTRSDLVILVRFGLQHARFPVHSYILKSKSEVILQIWKGYRRSRNEPAAININGYTPRIVDYLLRYMYTECLVTEVDETSIMSLLKLAHEYKVEDMVTLCVDRLTQCLSLTNWCEVLALATRLKLDTLREKCLEKTSALKGLITVMVENCLHFVLEEEDGITLFTMAVEVKKDEFQKLLDLFNRTLQMENNDSTHENNSTHDNKTKNENNTAKENNTTHDNFTDSLSRVRIRLPRKMRHNWEDNVTDWVRWCTCLKGHPEENQDNLDELLLAVSNKSSALKDASS